MAKVSNDEKDININVNEGSGKANAEKYAWHEIERWIPSKRATRKWFSTVLFIIVIAAVILLIVYGVAYASSPKGQRNMASAWDTVKEKVNIFSWYQRQIETARERTQNIWYAKTNISKQGIIFENFGFIGSAELPEGSPVILSYDLSMKNTELDETPLTILCNIKDKPEIRRKILPSEEIMVSGKSITENIRCRFEPEDIGELEGNVQIEGTVRFPFETRDVKLKVYYITEETSRDFPYVEDFFDFYDIDEDLPIRSVYNGEPIEVGIGVNSDNIQPIILGESRSPLIGITLRNNWEGTMMNLSDFIIVLPKGLEIDTDISQNPDALCPFEKARSGKTTIEYVASPYYIENIVIERGKAFTFECWLKQAENFIGNAVYTTKEYRASVSYNYELQKKTATLTIKEIGQ